MNISTLFCTSILICLLPCIGLTQEKVLRIHADFPKIHKQLDTIALINDALVAIDGSNDFYSTKVSFLMDSLLSITTSKCLRARGYAVKTVPQISMGGFMDTGLSVPILSDSLYQTHLPVKYLSDTQAPITSLHRVMRVLYINSIYGLASDQKNVSLRPGLQAHLDSLALFVKSDYVLFTFHQTVLVNPDESLLMGLGSLILTHVLSGGTIAAFMTKETKCYTYYYLVQLSSGKILWSNFSSLSLAPTAALLERAVQHQDKTLDMTTDTLSKNVLYYMHKQQLRNFPQKDATIKPVWSSKTFPSTTFFSPFKHTFNTSLSRTLSHQIDSMVWYNSLYEIKPIWKSNDTCSYIFGKGRPQDNLDIQISRLKEYLAFAYSSRGRFNPSLKGDLELDFVITQEGYCKNISIVNTSFNDPIFEYAVAYIVKHIGFGNANNSTGATKITQKISLQPPSSSGLPTISIGIFRM